MKPIAKGSLIVLAVMLLSANAAAAAGPEAKCEAGKNQESGKYAFCLHKAEARLLKTKGACAVATTTVCYRDEDCPMGETCIKDTTKYDESVTKCEDKYGAKWNTLAQKAAEVAATCPDGLLQADVKEAIDECVANVAAGLAGDGLNDCSGDLATCNSSLSTCSGTLSTCNADYSSCSGSLSTCNANYSSCSGSLSTCDANYSSCSGSLSTCNDNYSICLGSLATCNAGTATAADVLAGKTFSSGAGVGVTGTAPVGSNVTGADGSLSFTIPDAFYTGSKTCTATDSDLLAANIKKGKTILGVTGTLGLPKSAQTTAYGTGSDGNVQAGSALSYTDNGDGTITDNVTGLMWEKKDDSGGIHDKNNSYTWGMNLSPYTMNGTMVTTFLAALNAAGGFAGHTDWRIPNAKELQSIVDYEISYPGPAANLAFHKPATCTGCANVTAVTCSCTLTNEYWSSTTYSGAPEYAWYVDFSDGFVYAADKINGLRARAVRGGL